MKNSIVMAFRKVENGFVMELVPGGQGLIGPEYIAETPSDLRETAKTVLSAKLEDVINEITK